MHKLADVAQTPYADRVIERTNRWIWNRGRTVFELVAPGGRRYVMQSYSQIVDPGLTLAQPRPLRIGDDEQGERVWGELVAGNYFSVVGGVPLAGATLASALGHRFSSRRVSASLSRRRRGPGEPAGAGPDNGSARGARGNGEDR